ncbi:MAG: hypothetical protein OXT03_00065, partial [Alphaproteobacteria bacterium]|nr:hypothetical protein [Alphaproteobacteria bacterium]
MSEMKLKLKRLIGAIGRGIKTAWGWIKAQPMTLWGWIRVILRWPPKDIQHALIHQNRVRMLYGIKLRLKRRIMVKWSQIKTLPRRMQNLVIDHGGWFVFSGMAITPFAA